MQGRPCPDGGRRRAGPGAVRLRLGKARPLRHHWCTLLLCFAFESTSMYITFVFMSIISPSALIPTLIYPYCLSNTACTYNSRSRCITSCARQLKMSAKCTIFPGTNLVDAEQTVAAIQADVQRLPQISASLPGGEGLLASLALQNTQACTCPIPWTPQLKLLVELNVHLPATYRLTR